MEEIKLGLTNKAFYDIYIDVQGVPPNYER